MIHSRIASPGHFVPISHKSSYHIQFQPHSFHNSRNFDRSRCQATKFPDFIPPEVSEIQEPAAVEVLQGMLRQDLNVSGLGLVKTAYYHAAYVSTQSKDTPAFVLLHGFDSSMLEFRRFAPLLKSLGDVYLVDLAGWGFTSCGFDQDPNKKLGPTEKRAHLRAFIEQIIGRPVVLMGTSLGGTIALDFVINGNAHLVDKLVLIDAQGFIDGIGPLAKMPRFLSVLGVQVLRSVPLRQMANTMSYYDKQRYATQDALKIGRLHTFMPGWLDANVAFMSSGGYSVSNDLDRVNCPTLIVWGRNDEILDPKYADMFVEELKGTKAKVRWVEECGHVPALEQPKALLSAVKEFVGLTEGAIAG